MKKIITLITEYKTKKINEINESKEKAISELNEIKDRAISEMNVIKEKAIAEIDEIKNKLISKGIRCEVDERNEKISYKIFQAQVKKVPYMLIVGKKEQEQGVVSRSKAWGSQQTRTLSLASFADELANELHK